MYTCYISSAGAGTTDAILPAIPILLELASHTDSTIACTAAHCLATLTEMFPQDAAAGVISGDGLLLMADALQSSEQARSGNQQASVGGASSVSSSSAEDSGDCGSLQEEVDSDSLRQRQLLVSLAAAGRFQPPVNIMAGELQQQRG